MKGMWYVEEGPGLRLHSRKKHAFEAASRCLQTVAANFGTDLAQFFLLFRQPAAVLFVIVICII